MTPIRQSSKVNSVCFNTCNNRGDSFKNVKYVNSILTNPSVIIDNRQYAELKILYTNADCLNKTKLDELKQKIVTEKPHVICTTEVFPKHTSFE